MRTRRLFGLTLVVLVLHAIGWQIALGGLPRRAPARAGVHWLQITHVAQGERAPAPLPASGATGPVAAPVAAPPPGSIAAAVRGRPHAVAPAPHTRAGDDGVQRHASAEAAEWPVYATAVPPSITLRYALVQGGAPTATQPGASSAVGDAELEWKRDAATFSLRVTTSLADRPPREWQSTGGFDAAGVAPSRLVERERGHDKRAINFDRDRGRVRFSGATDALIVAAGAQDRWSWVGQLAAIAEADAQRGQVATHWDLQVAGLRGELERWTFRVLAPGDLPLELLHQGNDLSTSGDRAPALLHVLRAAERPYDLRIEAWLSPALHHLPAGLRMSAPPGGWSLSLWQRAS